MEFSVNTQEMQKIIKQLGVTAKTNTTDNAGRILIEVTEEHGVVFTSVGPTTSISISAERTEIKSPGTSAILYSKLKTFVTAFEPYDEEQGVGVDKLHFKLNDSNVHIKVKNKHFNGKTSRSSIKLDTFKTYTIPKPPVFETASFILNSDMLKAATDKVLYAVNPNESRKSLRGVYLNFDDQSIHFAGTDGLKLSEYKSKNTSDVKEGSHIINYDYVMGIKRLLPEDTQVFFEIKSGKILARLDNVVYVGKLVVGQEFPSYKEVLAKFSDTITIPKETILSSLKPFMGMLNQDDNNRLCLRINGKEMTFYNENVEFEYEEDLYEDKKLSIDVNGSFLMQTINAINDDQLLLKFSDSEGFLIFDSKNHEDQKALITSITQRS